MPKGYEFNFVGNTKFVEIMEVFNFECSVNEAQGIKFVPVTKKFN